MITIDKIDSFHLEDIKNIIHPSVFFSHEDYELFILRVPHISKDSTLDYFSLAFILSNNAYYFYDKNENRLIDLEDSIGFHKFLDKYIDNVLKTVNIYWSEIEEIEDMIYEGNPIKEFNKQWYKYKTDLIRINRVLSKAIEVFTQFMKRYRTEQDYLEIKFEDLFEHINRASRNTEHLLEKLDSIYNFHLNQTNEQMNRIVYILTLLSGIFLPLNLIVGFFGMNTTSLPFTKVDGGTFNVVSLLIISALLATLITFFMKKK